jgi:membrane-bound ClpP family serine protease
LPYAQNPSVISKEGSPTALLSVEVREKASIAREKAAREMLLESIAHTRSALEARRQAREAQRQQHVALVTQLQEIEALRNELQRDREMIRFVSLQIQQTLE